MLGIGVVGVVFVATAVWIARHTGSTQYLTPEDLGRADSWTVQAEPGPFNTTSNLPRCDAVATLSTANGEGGGVVFTATVPGQNTPWTVSELLMTLDPQTTAEVTSSLTKLRTCATIDQETGGAISPVPGPTSALVGVHTRDDGAVTGIYARAMVGSTFVELSTRAGGQPIPGGTAWFQRLLDTALRQAA